MCCSLQGIEWPNSRNYLRRPPLSQQQLKVSYCGKSYVGKVMWEKLSATSASHNKKWKRHTVGKIIWEILCEKNYVRQIICDVHQSQQKLKVSYCKKSWVAICKMLRPGKENTYLNIVWKFYSNLLLILKSIFYKWNFTGSNCVGVKYMTYFGKIYDLYFVKYMTYIW